MTGFLDWFFAFITTMFSSIWNGIAEFFKGLFHIFDFKTYFGLFSAHQEEFGLIGWILAVLAFVLVYAFWACIIVLIVLLIRRLIRFRKTVNGNEDLLEEIADLQSKLGQAGIPATGGAGVNASVNGPITLGNGDEPLFDSEKIGESIASVLSYGQEHGDGAENLGGKRFFRLDAVDTKYASYIEPPFNDSMSLQEIVEDLRNFACNNHLFYEKKTIRLLFAGFASTHMLILQGISGTGKTSLPYIIGKYLENDATITPVQPSWRDRTELFGFFNEFTKKFNETEVLRRIYESSYTNDINIIVLDELNISRVEYYFAEMLSVMEMPDPDEWKIQIVPSVWDNDPLHLENGILKIPQNVWYIGTANNDDSTFAISDKVYDRAQVINLDSKGQPFEAPQTTSKRISYKYLTSLFEKANEDYPVGDDIVKKIGVLDDYVIEKFRVAFGNRIMKQLMLFVPVYVAAGGTQVEAIDYILATKVFRKFEGLNLSLIRDEIRGLIAVLDELFGAGECVESIAFLRRLQKSY